MRPGRKKQEPLAYPGSEDETSNEALAWNILNRYGDVDIFYQCDPFTLLMIQEEAELEVEMRDQEISQAQHLVDRILSRLNERQRHIWRCRSESISFKDIAQALDCSERTIYNDWSAIRKIAWEAIEE